MNGQHVRFKCFVSSSSFLSFVWGWSLDLLDVRGQTTERHVPPRWHNDQLISVCSYAVPRMNPFLLPAFLKWHPHIKNLITLTHIFNPSDQVSPNPVLKGPNSAGFSIQPGGSHVQESFVYLVGQKSRPFHRTITFLWVCWPKIWFFLIRLTSLTYRQQYFPN